MPPNQHQTMLRPLPGYEPQPRQADSPTTIPTQQRPPSQQRPPGQLSLWLPDRQPPEPSGATFDHDKLATLLRAMVEVYGGRRDLRQIRHALHPDVAQQLATPARSSGRSYLLKSVHASSSTTDAIEACGTVQHGPRALAMCARFEPAEAGWVCTQFCVMQPRTPHAAR